MNMNQEEIKRLYEAFSFKDVEWKIQVATQDKTCGMAVAYLNSRAIQTRLDEVVGACNWKNCYVPWQNNAQLCGLSIYDSERKDWVTKYDGAENTEIEAVKGGLSDSFKRAAYMWGIGRYLYQIDGIWVDIEQRGKSWVIKNNQYSKLKTEYDNAIAWIFRNSANQGKPSVDLTEQKTPSAMPTQDNAQSESAVSSSDYRVQSVTPSGKESLKVELVKNNGEVISAFIKKGDKAVKTGSRLKDVNIVVKDSSYGQYNVLEGYRVAA